MRFLLRVVPVGRPLLLRASSRIVIAASLSIRVLSCKVLWNEKMCAKVSNLSNLFACFNISEATMLIEQVSTSLYFINILARTCLFRHSVSFCLIAHGGSSSPCHK